jgi:hypothetical protein
VLQTATRGPAASERAEAQALSSTHGAKLSHPAAILPHALWTLYRMYRALEPPSLSLPISVMHAAHFLDHLAMQAVAQQLGPSARVQRGAQ